MTTELGTEYSRTSLEIISLIFFQLSLLVLPLVSGSSILQFLVIQVVLAMGSFSQHWCQIRPVIGWPLPQLLCYHCPSTSFLEDRWQVESFVAQLMAQLTPGSLSGNQRWMDQVPILITRSTFQGHFHRFQDISTVPGFHITSQIPFSSSCVSLYSLPPSILPNLILPISIPTQFSFGMHSLPGTPDSIRQQKILTHFVGTSSLMFLLITYTVSLF